MAILQPFELRDFRTGVIRKASISSALVPPNSVSNSINVNYDTIIGSGVVRAGTTIIGSALVKPTPYGLDEFVKSDGTRMLVAAGADGTNTTIYYSTGGAWSASGLTTLAKAKVRFAQLGKQIFMANGTDVLKSSADAITWNTTNCVFTGDAVIPSLVFRSKSRLLVGGWSTYKDRVYFSSIIDPTTSPFISFNSNATTGNWIDINPDDGFTVTGFAETSGTTLVFKDQAIYRLDVISKTVETSNIFNIGAVSQEAIVECQGEVYFFSGYDIRRTNGGFPEQISRLGVQDFIDNIPQTNWSNVALGTDGINIYVSCGTVIVGFTTYTNLVLKYSPRDQSWSVHSYAQQSRFFCQFTSTSGRKMIGLDTAGTVQTYNLGTTDNGTPINFLLETQELEFGARAHINNINEKLIVFTQYGLNSRIDISEDDNDYKPALGSLNNRVNVINNLDITGNYFTIRWSGTSTQKAPILEGFAIENITDEGIE